MSARLKLILVLAVVIVAVAVFPLFSHVPPRFRLAEVTRGEIVSVVNSSGTIEPVKSVPIGSVVPGRVAKVHASHNTEVKKGDVLAEIDTAPNTDYSKVISPVDGIVIDRKVEEGQTLGDRQSAEMFLVAADLKKEVYVFASIDEADIGLIRAARLGDQPVFFTVDAYGEQLFQGKIQDIRINPTRQQGVVTYHVVVSAPNTELKLLPGMSAKLSFQIEKRADVIRIPSAALRYFPKAAYVRPEDHSLLEGTNDQTQTVSGADTSDTRSAQQRVEDRKKDSRRHVWVVDGRLLKAVEVTTGLNDNTFTELTSGDLQPGQQLVTGMQ